MAEYIPTPEEYAAAYKEEMRRQQGQAKEQPKQERKDPPAKVRGPQIGFLSAAGVERAFIGMLYVAVLLLVVLSLLGTFYGMQGRMASLLPPWRMLADAAALPVIAVAALALQVALSLTQYGARLMTHRDRRWWFLYLAALGVSVYYNFQAYLGPLMALNVPFLIASLFIIAGDVLPELIAIRRT